MFNAIKKLIAPSKSKAVNQVYNVGSVPMVGTWDFRKGLAYDNTYPSISRIADSFCAIRPYAIDSNGKPKQNANALNAIYHPNKAQSAVMFRYALATSALSNRKTYLLAYRRENGQTVAGGKITESNLAGFKFIENATVMVANGVKTYRIDNAVYSTDEVLEISIGADPNDLEAGYAPSVAIKKWADVDDFIASYQAGFFENGAVPAGEFVITARNTQDFEDIVAKLKRQHRGSGNNNNVVYVHRPMSPDTGMPLNAQIEYVPFQQSNTNLDLGTVFAQVNNKIDSAFGVPASIRGVSENNGYASAKVDERTFARYVLMPFATKLWDSFTHELNRITGGLGYAITFDLDIPSVADEEKVDAERKATELALILNATNAGYTLDSVVDAFELSNSYKLLKLGENTNDNQVIENDKPEVDEGNEVDNAPDTATEKSVPKEHRHSCCGHDHEPVAKSADRSTIKKMTDTLNAYLDKQLNENADNLEEILADETVSAMIEAAQTGDLSELDMKALYDAIGLKMPSDEDDNALLLALLALAYARMLKAGSAQFADTVKQFELEDTIPEDVRHYLISDKAKETYNQVMSEITGNFKRDNAEAIKHTIVSGIVAGLTIEQIRREVRKLKTSQQWRVVRIVGTEEHRAENLGKVDAITLIEKMARIQLKLRWKTTSGNPCEFCKSMEGTLVDAGEAFVPMGGTIEGEDGGVMINDYVPMLTPNAHPNCQCIFELIKVESEAK